MGYGGAEVSDPTTGPLWLGLVALTVCVAGGFAVGWIVGAWLGLGLPMGQALALMVFG